jgi:N-methylhydantoinase A
VKRPPTIVGVDTGGTFTDLVAFIDGRIRTLKVLSTPSNPAAAVLHGLRRLLDGHPKPALITYGSTVATNALLERRGARVVLLTTAGFEDTVELGRQARPRLYDLEPQKPAPLVPRASRLGVAERIGADGRVITPLTEAALRRTLRSVKRVRPQSIAVCLLHSYANPAHERRLGRALRGLNTPCSLSHELVAEYREYERLSTTVINAYVQPIMSRHLRDLQHGLEGHRLRVMQSNGGAIAARQAADEAVRTVLSGPAGGVIGACAVARSLGIDRAITFDMGGTSTDVSLIDGVPGYQTEWEIGGLPIKVPALAIHTVGAGGGSLARMDAGGALKVGPESAGADPGPACYGKGTHPTVTDANLVLGRLAETAFLGGQMQLDGGRASRALKALGREMRLSAEGAAEGVVRVANASMERAIRSISVERGHDPREYALIAFGGAAGQHACELAQALGIRRVVAPAHAGLLSAWGGASASVQRDYVRTVRLTAPSPSRLRDLFRPLEKTARKALREEGIAPAAGRLQRSIDVRYCGQSYEIRLPLTPNFLAAFHRAHQRLYGYADTGRAVEVVNLRLLAVGRGPRLRSLPEGRVSAGKKERQRVRWTGRWISAELLSRSQLQPGAPLAGPLIVTELSATTFVPPGWKAKLHTSGHLELFHAD